MQTNDTKKYQAILLLHAMPFLQKADAKIDPKENLNKLCQQ